MFKIISIISISLYSVLLVGCSSSNVSLDEDFEIDSNFVNEVSLVCIAAQDSATDATRSNFSLNDPEFFQTTLSSAEEQFDKMIAGFTDLDPQSEIRSDWSTFLDDFTAIRDSFPQLLSVLNQLVILNDQQNTLLDIEEIESNRNAIDSLQKEYEMITRSNRQRLDAIAELSKEYGFIECDLR